MQILKPLFLYKQIPWRLGVVLERWHPLASQRKSGKDRRTVSTNSWPSTSSDSHSASGSWKSCHGNCWCQEIQTLFCKFSTILCKWKWKFMYKYHIAELLAMWYFGFKWTACWVAALKNLLILHPCMYMMYQFGSHLFMELPKEFHQNTGISWTI